MGTVQKLFFLTLSLNLFQVPKAIAQEMFEEFELPEQSAVAGVVGSTTLGGALGAMNGAGDARNDIRIKQMSFYDIKKPLETQVLKVKRASFSAMEREIIEKSIPFFWSAENSEEYAELMTKPSQQQKLLAKEKNPYVKALFLYNQDKKKRFFSPSGILAQQILNEDLSIESLNLPKETSGKLAKLKSDYLRAQGLSEKLMSRSSRPARVQAEQTRAEVARQEFIRKRMLRGGAFGAAVGLGLSAAVVGGVVASDSDGEAENEVEQ